MVGLNSLAIQLEEQQAHRVPSTTLNFVGLFEGFFASG